MRWMKKGPARGDERGLQRPARRSGRPIRTQPGRRSGCNSSEQLSVGGGVGTIAKSERQPCTGREAIGCGRLPQVGIDQRKQKKRPHPKMGPNEKDRSPNLKWWQMDEGGGYAICRWPQVEGGGYDLKPVSQSRTEGGGYGAAHIDTHNMHFDRLVHNAELYMPAMQFAQVKVSHAAVTYASTTDSPRETECGKNKAPLEGRAGPSSSHFWLQGGTNNEREEEEGDALSCCRAGIYGVIADPSTEEC